MTTRETWIDTGDADGAALVAKNAAKVQAQKAKETMTFAKGDRVNVEGRTDEYFAGTVRDAYRTDHYGVVVVVKLDGQHKLRRVTVTRVCKVKGTGKPRS